LLAEQLSVLGAEKEVAAVVLHVSGYGYQKRGVPVWLLEGLRTWRKAEPSCRLFAIFHELFATGRIWNSSFWLSNAQKYVTRSIWDLCDGALATTSLYSKQLALWRLNMKPALHTMPVFSNVGEPKFVAPTEQRPANIAVFGQAGIERIVYADSDDGLWASLAESLGVLNIIDIGVRNFPVPGRLGQIPITALGQLSPESVSERLISCRFGLLRYDVGRLEKSGVFAAYAAHGVIPVCVGSEATPSSGLEEGKHFLRWPFRVPPKLGAMQDRLVEWYAGHSIARHADLVGSWCVLGKKSQKKH
jgi:hypothetical protein